MIPAAVIDRLFKRLAATYGAAWDRAMGNAPLEDVREVWAHELAGFGDKLSDIAWALDNLPEKCPNVLEFRTHARRAPPPVHQRLESPRASEKVVAEEIAKQTDLKAAMAPTRDPKQWAYDLRDQHQAGKALGPHQIRAYREALGIEGRMPWQ